MEDRLAPAWRWASDLAAAAIACSCPVCAVAPRPAGTQHRDPFPGLSRDNVRQLAESSSGSGRAVPKPAPALSATVLRSVLDQLSLAIFVFRGERLIYTNPPATRLVNRLRTKYRIELAGDAARPSGPVSGPSQHAGRGD